MSPEDRDRLATLIEANHTFPGPFFFSVIANNTDETRNAIRAAFAAHFEATLADSAFAGTASAGGRYMSHRITVECRSVEQVMTMFDRLATIEGVVAVL